MVHTESLVLDIRSNTQDAVKGIQKLNQNLDKLASSLSKVGRYSNVFKGSMFGGIKGVDNTFGNLNKTIKETQSQLIPERFMPAFEAAKNQVNGLAGSTVAFGKSGVSSFSNLTDSVARSSSALTGLSAQMTQIMGVVGFGSILQESIDAAKIRESNQMFLSLNIEDSEVNDVYNKIQDLVVRLPGNDQFLTSILTLSKSQAPKMSDKELEQLGVATAEYYAAANAKGQFTYETEKELRGYLLSGNTLAFKNSMISQHMDLLKNQNSITDRAIALEEALTRSGFDGMATMDSYANVFERWKGLIEKGFADVGQLILPLLKSFYKVYEAIDRLTMSGLTDTLLILGGTITLLGASTLTLGFGFSAIRHSFEGLREGIALFDMLSKSAETNLVKVNGLRGGLNHLANNIAGAIASESARTDARVLLNSDELMNNMKIKLPRADVSEYRKSLKELDDLYKIGGKGRTKEDLAFVATITELKADKNLSDKAFASLNGKAFNKEMSKTLDKLSVQGSLGYKAAIAEIEGLNTATALNTYEEKLNTIARHENTIATVENKAIAESSIGVRLRELKTKISTTIANYSEASSIDILKGAKSTEAIETTKNTWTKHFNTVAKWLNVGATTAETDSTNVSIISKIRETLVNIKNAVSAGIKAAANYVLAVSQGAVNSELGITAVLTGIITSELFLIVAGILAVVTIIEKVGEGLGYWKDFGSMVESIKSGIGRLWDAFVNSNIVQGVIKLFQTLGYYIGESLRILGVFLGNLFGGGSGEQFDFVQGIINVFGNLSNILITAWEYIRRVIAAFKILGVLGFAVPGVGQLLFLVSILEDVAYWLEVFEKAWNQFVDSSDFDDVMQALSDAGMEIQKAFEPIWEVFAEIGEAIAEGFGSGEVDDAQKNINIIVEALRWIGNFIKIVIIPLVTTVAKIISFIVQISGVYQIAKLIAWLHGNGEESSDTINSSYNETPKNLASTYTSTQNLTKTSKTLNDNTTQVNYIYNVEEGAIQNKTSMSSQELENQQNKIFRKNWVNGSSYIGPGARTI